MRRLRSAPVGALVVACVLASGCGAPPKSEPTQDEARDISRSVSDIVEQCGAAESGFVAGVDEAALRRDVDDLLRLSERVLPDAEYRIDGLPPELAMTTLAQQLRLAALKLDPCAPTLAKRVDEATE